MKFDHTEVNMKILIVPEKTLLLDKPLEVYK
jgi:hypothetical protein